MTKITAIISRNDDDMERAENIFAATGLPITSTIRREVLPKMAQIVAGYRRFDADALRQAMADENRAIAGENENADAKSL